jgi:hypothetical protein
MVSRSRVMIAATRGRTRRAHFLLLAALFLLGVVAAAGSLPAAVTNAATSVLAADNKSASSLSAATSSTTSSLRRGAGAVPASSSSSTGIDGRHRRIQTSGSSGYPIVVPIFLLILLCCVMKQQERNRQQQQQQHLDQPAAVAPAAVLRTTTAGPITGPEGLPRSRLVTTATTKSPAARCGMGFVGTDHACITRILSHSIFHGSELEPGMKIVSINNLPIHSNTQAAEALTAAKDVVTIVAHSAGYYGSTDDLVVATVRKTLPYQAIGVVYKKEGSHEPVRLGAFGESSLFRSSSSSSSPHDNDLSAGMQVVTVNNILVSSVEQAVSVTRSAYPLVTILARRSAAVAVLAEANGVVVTAEPVVSYALSSRDDPIVATAMATPVMIDDSNVSSDHNNTRELTL